MSFSTSETLRGAAESNPSLMKSAERFLLDAHGHGFRGADELHAHAIVHNTIYPDSPIDALTVHVALALEWEREDRKFCRHGYICVEGARLWVIAQDTWDAYLEVAGIDQDGDGAAQWAEYRDADRAFENHRNHCQPGGDGMSRINKGLPQRIHDELSHDGGWLTEDGIALLVGPDKSLNRTLWRMVKQGHLEKRPRPTSGPGGNPSEFRVVQA